MPPCRKPAKRVVYSILQCLLFNGVWEIYLFQKARWQTLACQNVKETYVWASDWVILFFSYRKVFFLLFLINKQVWKYFRSMCHWLRHWAHTTDGVWDVGWAAKTVWTAWLLHKAAFTNYKARLRLHILLLCSSYVECRFLLVLEI